MKKCSHCGGRGDIPRGAHRPSVCPVCNGSGWEDHPFPEPTGDSPFHVLREEDVYKVGFSFYEGDYVFEGAHKARFETLAAAVRLLLRIQKANPGSDHVGASPHWGGYTRLSYQGFCNQFSLGMVDEDGRATF